MEEETGKVQWKAGFSGTAAQGVLRYRYWYFCARPARRFLSVPHRYSTPVCPRQGGLPKKFLRRLRRGRRQADLHGAAQFFGRTPGKILHWTNVQFLSGFCVFRPCHGRRLPGPFACRCRRSVGRAFTPAEPVCLIITFFGLCTRYRVFVGEAYMPPGRGVRRARFTGKSTVHAAL